MGAGSGRPKTSSSIKAFLEDRAKKVAEKEHADDDDDSDDEEEEGNNRSIIGRCLVDPVAAEGKKVFGFEIGERLVLKYVEKNPDAIFRKYVGSMFKCTVMRYCAKKAKRSGGKVVDNGGDLEVKIKWDDAPAGFKVRGKSICGEEQRLTIEEFNSTYEVVKKEKPAIVIGDI